MSFTLNVGTAIYIIIAILACLTPTFVIKYSNRLKDVENSNKYIYIILV